MKLQVFYQKIFIKTIVIFCVFWQYSQAQEAEVKKIKENFEQKHYKLCVQACNELIQKSPQLTTAYYYRAKSFFQQEKYNTALLDFNKVLELDPNFSEGYAHRGACKKKLNQELEACIDWRSGIEKGDTKSKELFDLYCQKVEFSAEAKQELQKAEVLIGEKYYQKAIKYLDRAEFLNPKNAKIFLLKGLVQQKLQNIEMAIFYIEKAIQLNANYTEAYNARANAFMEGKEYSLALNDLNTSLTQDDKQIDLYLKRGKCKNLLQKQQEAVNDFNIFLAKNPKSAEALRNRAEAYKAFAPQKALADYETILKNNSLDSLALYQKARILFDFGQIDQACRDWQQAFYLGVQNAKKDFQRYCESTPSTAENLQQKALEKIQKQDFSTAKIFLDKSIAINPKNHKSFYYRGATLLQLKKYEQAIKDFNTYLQFNFSDGQAFYYRGLAYKNLMKLQLACEDLTEAQSLGIEVSQQILQESCNR